MDDKMLFMEDKTMQCECGKTIFYNYHYHCFNCKCGKCYNAVGNKLAPLEYWKDEYDKDWSVGIS